MDPPVLNLGTIQFSRKVHFLAVLVPEVEPQYLLHKRLWVGKAVCLCRDLNHDFLVEHSAAYLLYLLR